MGKVQQDLFTQAIEVDLAADPYAEARASARRLAADYRIAEDEAFDLVLGHGSEVAARRALDQRWWLSDDEPGTDSLVA